MVKEVVCGTELLEQFTFVIILAFADAAVAGLAATGRAEALGSVNEGQE